MSSRRRLQLPYGRGELALEIPRERLAWVASLGDADGGERAGSPFEAAVERLVGAGFPAAVRGRELGLFLADGTRDWRPLERLAPLLPVLRGAAGVTAFLCTGTHDPEGPENRALAAEVRALLAAAPIRAEVVIHDARGAEFQRFGRTRRGTPVEVSAAVSRCELTLTLADMKHHYFAGYSNPTKYLVPGLAALETVRANHALALEPQATFGRHPWHADPARRTNPLAEDLVEAYELSLGDRQDFAVVWIGTAGGCLWADGGRTRAVVPPAMEAVDRVCGRRLEPVDLLILSAGGHPLDESLYTAQRAIELSRAAVRPGGRVLFLAACTNGIGPPSAERNFFLPLTRPLEEIQEPSREEYELYGHKPVKLARVLRDLAALYLFSELPPGEVERIHMEACAAPQEVVEEWLRRCGEGEQVGVVRDGSKVAVLG